MYKVVKNWVDVETFEHVRAEPRANHRCGVEGAFGRGIEAVDARGEHGLQRAWHADVAGGLDTQIAAAPPDQHVPLLQIPNDLLCEERVTSGAVGDQVNDLG